MVSDFGTAVLRMVANANAQHTCLAAI